MPDAWDQFPDAPSTPSSGGDPWAVFPDHPSVAAASAPPQPDLARSDMASQNPLVNAGMAAAATLEKPYKAFERGLSLIAGPGLGLISPQNQLVQAGLNTQTNYPYDPSTISGMVGSGAANLAEGFAGPAGLGAMAIGAGEDKAEQGGNPVNVLGTMALNAALGKLMPGQKVNQAILVRTPALRNAIVNSVKNTLISSGVGVAENEAFNVANNLLDRETGLDPNRSLTAGAGESAVQGLVFGGGGQAVHEASPLISRIRGRRTAEAGQVKPQENLTPTAETAREVPPPTSVDQGLPRLPGETDAELLERKSLTVAAKVMQAQDEALASNPPENVVADPIPGSVLDQHMKSLEEKAPPAPNDPKIAAMIKPPKEFASAKDVGDWAAGHDPDVKEGMDPDASAATSDFFAEGAKKLEGGDGKFVLADVPIDTIPERGNYQPDAVQEYAGKPAASSPPAVGGFDPSGEFVLVDGNTRRRAALARGEKTLKTYVPESALAKIKGKGEPTSSTIADVGNSGQTSRAAIRNNQIPGTPPHESRVPKGIEELITPINSRVRDISPPIYGDMMRTLEKEPMQRTAEQKARMLPALRVLDKHLDNPEIRTAWLNNDVAKVKSLLPEAARPALDTVRSIMDELHGDQKKAGVDVGHLENYLPRGVKDYEGLLKTLGGETKGQIDAALDQARKLKGAPLTDAEKRDTTNSVVQGYGPRKPAQGKPAFAKERKIDAVTPEQAQFYENPLHTALSYIDRANRATGRAKFLGKGTDPSTLMASIGERVSKEVEAGNIPKDKQDELISHLHTRLLADNLHMGGIAGLLRNSVYATTITHLWSGVNQLTDIATSARRHGIKATIGGGIDALHITPSDSRLVAKDMGIDHRTGEFRDPGKLDALLNYGTKLNAFQKIDIFTKEAELNASARAIKSSAASPDSAAFKRLQRDWEPVLGKQKFAEAMDAARKGDLKNESLKDLAFMKLTEVQPITLSNMPEKYLKMKDGRVFYTLKTFMLQSLDNIRRDTVRKMATPGQRAEGTKNLAVLLALGTMAGMTKDAVKDMLQGKPLEDTGAGSRVAEAMLGIVGLTRYTANKGMAAPFKTLLDMVMPPVSQFDAPFADVASAGDNKGLESVKLIPAPFINDMLYYHTPIGRGNTRTYENGLSRLHDSAVASYADHDFAAARNYVQLHNALEKDAPEGVNKRKNPLTVRELKSLQKEAK